MKILALRGGSSCGKTATLNLVYDRLIALGGIASHKVKLGGDPKDFEDIVIYKGQKIAFFTMGDYAYASINAITKYAGLKVDVLIIASNVKFVRPIKVIVSYPHHLINKTVSSPSNPANDLIANTTDAATILGLI
ncbi:MAG: hypothetical protein EAY81_10065 [Bacteroidetes bacterium]|nr:MAG: hypothetical protein EAY81_10065 [Bacteroidota bacterium]